jgi:nucleoside diphosphate kinase
MYDAGIPHSDQPNITFVMIKSDAIRNNVVDFIIQDILGAGFSIIHRHPFDDGVIHPTLNQTAEFYKDHILQPYFPQLRDSVMGGVIPLILEYTPASADDEHSAVTKMRQLIGATNGRNALPETIRAKFGGHKFDEQAPLADNAIHASDSLAQALLEIKIMCPTVELIKSITYGPTLLNELRVG